MTKINIYKNRGEWCYAAIIDGQYDHSDTVGVADGATEAEARAEVAAKFAAASIARVADTNI